VSYEDDVIDDTLEKLSKYCLNNEILKTIDVRAINVKRKQHCPPQEKSRNVIAHHDIDKQVKSPLVYTLRYALVYIIGIIFIRVISRGRNPWCNHGSRWTSVHPEEQHTGSEDSIFYYFKLSCL
jgi:hypothetical protein